MVLEAIECLFDNVWTMLTSLYFPGTEMSFAQILIGVFLAGLSLRILSHAFGLSAGDIPKPTTHIERKSK